MNVVTLKAAQVKWDINAYASPPHQREWGLSQARTSPPPLEIITDLSPILRPGTSGDVGFVVRLESP